MKDTRQKWFKEAKYGLFIHWGLYSLLAGEYKGRKTDRIAEWIMNFLNIPVEEYELLANEFNPVEWDADLLVRRAKEWGMKYVVVTSKHHDGFAMYHSDVSYYNIVDATPFKRDIVAELAQACKKYDLKFGVYYSQAQDWHDPNGFRYWNNNDEKDFQYYLDHKCIPQVKELLTKYGEISIIWFDTPMSMTVEQSRALVDVVKTIQPNCIISGRIGNNLGDYMTTGDNFIPSQPYLGDWEVPATLNDTWGYNKYDKNWKTPEEILNLFIKINSRGGNYLLNVGPDGLGNVPEASIQLLDEVASYVNPNSVALFNTNAVVGNPYELDYGVITHAPHKIFIHVMYKGKYRLELQNIGNVIEEAKLLETGEVLKFSTFTACEGNTIIEVELPEEYQYSTGYCVQLTCKESSIQFEPLIE
jgi:alpha-L-fucosidase